MLFDIIFTAVFENIVFNPWKIKQETCLGPSFAQKVVEKLKASLWAIWRFYYDFFQCTIIKTGKGRFSTPRGKNRTKLACLVQILNFLC
jgi:hypothetical protein